MKDCGSGFAQSCAARIHTHREMTHKRKCSLEMGHVNGVGVGKQSQTALRREALEQQVRKNRAGAEDAVPDRAKLFKIQLQLEFLADMRVPIARIHAAF